jgi:hypothetical protein
MTNSKLKSWLISGLRRMTMRYPPRNEALRAAKTEKKINVSSGRLAQHYRCAGCGGEFTAKNICIDHVIPIIPPGVGFTTWDEYIARMFCPVENLQALCKTCHDVKSIEERQQRKVK